MSEFEYIVLHHVFVFHNELICTIKYVQKSKLIFILIFKNSIIIYFFDIFKEKPKIIKSLVCEYKLGH